jgi:mutator family transposase
VPARLSPTERIRAQIDELFAGGQPLAETLEEAARLSVRLVIQAALEAEVSEFLGRDRYQRDPDAGPGYRNGHQPVQVKTTAGPVVLERPKLRATSQPFVSRLLGKGVSRTNALDALVLASFVGGLSVRDVEAALAEALGPEAALSKSTVCRICQVIKEEFDAFTTRDLGGMEVDYLFLDGTHFRYHPGAPAEPVLVAWGVTTTGGPVLLGLAPGSHEGTDPWAGFLEELIGRGLGAPLLVITDGAPGLCSAVELAFPRSLRQRCLIHRARNVLAKVPTHAPGRGQGGLLADLRRYRRPSWRPGGRRGPSTRQRLRRPLPASLPSCGQLPDRHPARADLLLAVSTRALAPDSAHQPDRADLRRDPPPHQGDRPAARRALVPEPGLGGPGPRQPRVARRHPDSCWRPAPPRPPPRPAAPASPAT